MNIWKLLLLGFASLVIVLVANEALSARDPKTFIVSRQGSNLNEGTVRAPFRTIQHALDIAIFPGDRILVRGGTYRERIRFVASGTARRGYITLKNFRDERVILNGRDVPGQNMVLIENLNYVKLIGFEIVNNIGVRDGSGVRVLGRGHHIVIVDNLIREMRGRNAMGITVYATSVEAPISWLTIKNNHIYNCDPAPSEALTVNGNVVRFTIADNLVHDVNNIGIDAIGGELDINPDPTLVARNGAITGNTVFRARSSYGGGFGAGIYVDGGRNIRVDGNEVFQCDLGIEIGAENSGIVTSGVHVRSNIVYDNDKAGIVFGGFARNTGRVNRCRFLNNTLYKNDALNLGFGQIWVQYAENNLIANNIIQGSASDVLLNADQGSVNNRFDFNIWNSQTGKDPAEFVWEGRSIIGFDEFRAYSGQGQNSLFGNPGFAQPNRGRYELRPGSRAIDAGTNRRGWYAPTDFNGTVRRQRDLVDMGAIEYSSN